MAPFKKEMRPLKFHVKFNFSHAYLRKIKNVDSSRGMAYALVVREKKFQKSGRLIFSDEINEEKRLLEKSPSASFKS